MTTAPVDLSAVIPVYNEGENLPVLWPDLREALDATGQVPPVGVGDGLLAL